MYFPLPLYDFQSVLYLSFHFVPTFQQLRKKRIRYETVAKYWSYANGKGDVSKNILCIYFLNQPLIDVMRILIFKTCTSELAEKVLNEFAEVSFKAWSIYVGIIEKIKPFHSSVLSKHRFPLLLVLRTQFNWISHADFMHLAYLKASMHLEISSFFCVCNFPWSVWNCTFVP